MRIALVGYTGFVGSNLYETGKFDAIYNSKNITEAYGTCPDLLIYAGLRAEKYLANNMPERDLESILEAQSNIEKIKPHKLVLISTIDVFKNPVDVDENSEIDTEGLHAYGYNRYQLERWVREKYSDALIIRLPGLFGKNIKKNFIYDYISIIPFMIIESKFNELLLRKPDIKKYYELQDNGFYRLSVMESEKEKLKNIFVELGFSALNFTDSRSVYQFYNLKRLWSDILVALNSGLQVWHPATEPVSASEVYRYLSGKEFINELKDKPVYYNYKTIYFDIYGGKGGYIAKKEEVLGEIKEFVEENKWMYR